MKNNFDFFDILIKVQTSELRTKLIKCEINVISEDLKQIFKSLPISDSIFTQDIKYWITKFNNINIQRFLSVFLVLLSETYLAITSILLSLFAVLLYFLSKLPFEKIFQPLIVLTIIIFFIIVSAFIIYTMGRSTFDSPQMHEGIIVGKSLKYLKNLALVYELVLDSPQQSYKYAKQVLEIEKNKVESNDKKIIEYSIIISFICFVFVVFSIRETNIIDFSIKNFHVDEYFDKKDLKSLGNISLTSPLFALIFLIYRFRLISWQAKKLNQIKYCLSLIDEVIKMKGYSESDKKA